MKLIGIPFNYFHVSKKNNTYAAIPQIRLLEGDVFIEKTHFGSGPNAMQMQMLYTYKRWPVESIRNIVQIQPFALK